MTVTRAIGSALVAIIAVSTFGRISLTVASGADRPSPTDRLARHFPNVPLRTDDGREVRFYDDLVKGKVVMVYFMFTACTTLCPRTTANLVRVQRALGDRAGRDVFIVSLSVDPDHDTPAVLRKYAESYHTGAGWTFATGRLADIDAIRRGLGVRDNDDLSQHTGMLIYGNEPFGRWASTPVMQDPTTLAAIVLGIADPRANR